MSILEVQGLKKVYSTRFGGNKVEALKNVNLTQHLLTYLMQHDSAKVLFD